MSELNITGITNEFAGVARDADGKTVFVPGALPGETVRARRVKEEKRYALGVLEDIFVPSPHRVAPACPYYEKCGGCSAMHAAYEYSLELKRQSVKDVLTRIGGAEEFEMLPCVPSPSCFRTRNKAEYAVTGDGRSFGVMREKSHDVLAISDCLQQKEESIRILNALSGHGGGLSGLVTRVSRSGEVMVILSGHSRSAAEKALNRLCQTENIASAYFCELSMKPHHALDGKMTCLAGSETIPETVDGLSFRVSPRSFFQVNLPVAEKLYRRAVSLALEEEGPVLDVYCGTGTMTLMAARERKVTGVEIVPEAIADAKRAAAENGLKADFVCAAAEDVIQHLPIGGSVILDPPRKGADKKVLDAIIRGGVRRVTYVSCDPGTLARDVRVLREGGFRLDKAECYDMFPETKHVETVCLLSKLSDTKHHVEVELNLDAWT